MYQYLQFLNSYLKSNSAKVDDLVFKLHYRLTFALLACFSVLVASSQFFGDPISCQTAKTDIRNRLLDDYCWIRSTYTLPDAYDKKKGEEVPFPGLDNTTPDSSKVYHAYYQWVSLFLFCQAVLFYVPRYIWTKKESGKVKKLLMDLDKPVLFPPRESPKQEDENSNPEGKSSNPEDQQRKRPKKDVSKRSFREIQQLKLKSLAKYLNVRFGAFNKHPSRYYFCEVLNFINVIGQILLTNAFLGYEFTTYGMDVIRFSRMDQGDRDDPMIKVFPRVTKCTFYAYGTAGSVQNMDAICILPTNIFNEKIYVFLWFYFIVLAIATGLKVLYSTYVLICLEFIGTNDKALGILVRDKTLQSTMREIIKGVKVENNESEKNANGMATDSELKAVDVQNDSENNVKDSETNHVIITDIQNDSDKGRGKDAKGIWYILTKLQKNLDSNHFSALLKELDGKLS